VIVEANPVAPEPQPELGWFHIRQFLHIAFGGIQKTGQNVAMPRPVGGSPYTQTRTFNYDLATGRLMSTVQPENGTTTYAYYASGRLQSKVDAKSQKVTYSYDGYGRLKYIDRYPDGTTWDSPLCQHD
jgi:YD repeat-containing protein